MKKQLLTLFSATILFATANAFAGPYTVTRVDGGPDTLVQGRDYQYRITSTPITSDPVFIDVTGPNPDHNIQAGTAQIGPNKFKMIGGQLDFFIRFHEAPGTLTLTITNANDPGQVDSIPVDIKKHPTQFTITPNPPSIIAGIPFSITVQAKDSDGVLVTPFEDDVQITNLPSGASALIPGSSFSGGEATVQHQLNIADFNNLAHLNVKLVGITYMTPAPQPQADDTFGPLLVAPSSFTRLAMLFPGEQLNPGGPKTGNVQTQVAGNPVTNVDIWPLDNWFNPIRGSVNIPVTFTSNVGGDVMPGPITVINPPYPMSGGGPDRFLFLTNGTRVITALAGTGETSTSNVPVLPGSNTTFEFTIQPSGTYTTDDIINVQITAKETASGLVLTNLQGPLPNALLTAKYNALLPVEEDIIWVDTDTSDLQPDNVVFFNSGIANVALKVTRRGQQIELCYEDEHANRVCSNQFNVDPGALNKIHLTIVGNQGVIGGEQFTPGTYPGNSGQAPTMTAGQQLIVEARLVDEHWNVITSPNPTFTKPIQLNSIINDTYIVPTPPNANFDATGELLYNSNPTFDQSFRVAVRTAGTDRKFSATSDFGPGNGWNSSTITVLSASYSRLVIAAPGETLRPGSFFPEGKEGSPPTPQAAGQLFGPVTVYATDVFWNPIDNGPYPSVIFDISPSNPASFINGFNLGVPVALGNNFRNFQVNLAETSDIRVDDGPRNATVQVQAGSGALDHFVMTVNSPGPFEAGQFINVTIEAQDEFDVLRINDNGTVDLAANSGPQTMSPTQVTLSGGRWTGDIQFFTAGTGRHAIMSRSSVISNGPNVDISVQAAGYQRLLLVGPDETHLPGTPLGKSGNNANRTVGTGVTINAIATDFYYNQVNTAGNTINFTSDQYANFSPASGVLSAGDFATTMVMQAAATHTITAEDPTLSFQATTQITGDAGPYSKVQILAPGELPDPGNTINGGKDPSATPSTQTVSIPFPVTIRAVDQFYNLTGYNGGDTTITVDTINSVVTPPNNQPGGLTPRPFVNGQVVRNVLIVDQGFRNIVAADQDDLTKTSQLVQIQLDPGPVYVFSTPATATAGSNFSVTITLEDGGVPLAGYNESIFLDAFLPGGGPASGSFLPDGSAKEYIMSNGQVIINDLSYAYVEDIQIRLTDNFSRVAFSSTVVVNPSALRYNVVVPSSGVAGPPLTFPITVELRDQVTDTIVSNPNYNHTIGVTALSLLSTTTAGTLSIAQAPLNNGIALLNASYSKAEEIQIEISDLNGTFSIASAFSNSITLKADGYKKLLIIAPGETHTPGIFQDPTGKSGNPNSLEKSLSHIFQVRGVDQHWNTVDTFSGGQIFFQADDGSTNATNPTNQNAPLVNGQSAASIIFANAGNISLTASDAADPSIVPQTVLLPVSGAFFDIQAPAQTNSGAPFNLVITLKDTMGGTIPSNGPITIEALHTDGTPASGTLDVTSANLTAGVVTIPNQSYTIAEDIRLRVSGQETISISQTISFVPRAIFYRYEQIPAEAEVNVPFDLVIRAYDQDTGTPVVNFNRSNLPLQAFSATTGLPSSGTFVPTSVNIVNGVGSVTPVYDTAESIFLQLTDNTTVFDPPPVPTQATYPSPSTILVTPGSLASVDNLGNLAIQSNENLVVTYVARDSFNNPIPDQAITISVNEPGFRGSVLINGNQDTATLRTDSNGQLSVDYRFTADAHGLFQMTFVDAEKTGGFSTVFDIEVLGLLQGPKKALPLGGNRIPVNSNWMIEEVETINSQAGSTNGFVKSFYQVDGLGYVEYNPAIGILANDPNRPYPAFTETRSYVVEWYSEVCYGTPNCSNPVSTLAINGAPSQAIIITYVVDGKMAGFPSPFNPKKGEMMTIQYPLPEISSVKIEIYSLFGEKIKTIEIPAGATGAEARQDNQVFWDGTNDDGVIVGNGGYIIRVEYSQGSMKNKVLVVK